MKQISIKTLEGAIKIMEPKKENPTDKALKLAEVYRLLYGDVFPEYERIEFSQQENSIVIVYNPNWRGTFTFNGPRDYKLVF